MKIKGWDIAFGSGSSVIQVTQRFGDNIVAFRVDHVEFVYAKPNYMRKSIAKIFYNYPNLAQEVAEHLSGVKESTILLRNLLTCLPKLAKLYNIEGLIL